MSFSIALRLLLAAASGFIGYQFFRRFQKYGETYWIVGGDRLWFAIAAIVSVVAVLAILASFG